MQPRWLTICGPLYNLKIKHTNQLDAVIENSKTCQICMVK